MQTDLIIINDFCDRCHVDPSFIMELEEDGLIEVRVIDEERYLPTSQLAELERYTHLYYDLSINIAGIDAIHHMLERIELLQQEVRSLRNELNSTAKIRVRRGKAKTAPTSLSGTVHLLLYFCFYRCFYTISRSAEPSITDSLLIIIYTKKK